MSNPTIQHYINGRISEGSSGQTQDVFNPATGKVSGQTALANRDDVDQAVAAATQGRPARDLDTPAFLRRSHRHS